SGIGLLFPRAGCASVPARGTSCTATPCAASAASISTGVRESRLTLARLRDLATTTGDIHACIASSDLARHGTQQCLGQSPAPLGLRGAEPIRLRSAAHGILPVDPGDTQPYPDRRPLLRRCTGGRLTWPRRVGEPHPLPDPGDAAPDTVRRRPPPDRVVRGAGRNRARPHHPLSP